MRKLVFSITAFAAFIAGPALAADLPVKAPPPIAPAYSWTGVYFGFDAGWVGTKDIGGPFQFPAAPGNSFIAPGVNGAAWGAFAGAQYQFNMVVIGVEGGITQRIAEGFSSTLGLGSAPPIGCNAAVVFSCQGNIGDIYQVGPRVGLAFDKFLVYGTGGWAATHLTTQAITNATNTPLALGSTMNRGWFAGGGLDWVIYRMSPDFAAVIGVNYTHYDFDQGIHDSGVNGRFVSTTADAVTVRLSFKYDASGVLVRR